MFCFLPKKTGAILMEGGSKQDLPKMKAMDVDKDSSAVTSIEMVCRKNVNNVDGKKGGWNCEPK